MGLSLHTTSTPSNRLDCRGDDMIKLYLVQGKKTLDISELLQSMSTSGRKGAAGRSLSATILYSSNFDRPSIDVMKGNHVIAYDDDMEIFRGIIISQSEGRNRTCQIEARDNLIYLANNDDTFNYENKTASFIFKDLCTRFQIAFDTVVDTSYVIPKLSIENGKLWDCVLEALQATYKATGERFYATSKKGKANLLKRKEEVQKWVIEEGSNLVDYSRSRSIDGIVTRVKIVSSKGGVLASASDTALEEKIGVFQKVIQKGDDLNAAQASLEVKTLLKLESNVKEQLSVTGLGISSILAGAAVYIIIPELGIKQSFYVDEDSHTYAGNHHEMQLTLNKTHEI